MILLGLISHKTDATCANSTADHSVLDWVINFSYQTMDLGEHVKLSKNRNLYLKKRFLNF